MDVVVMREDAVCSRSARLAGRHARRWAFPLAALLLLVRCGVTRCPEGTAARFDQCVRFSEGRDGGADASNEAALGSGDARADAEGPTHDGACDADRWWSGDRCVLKEIFVDGRDGDDAHEGTQQEPLKTFKQAMRLVVAGQIVSFEGLEYSTDQGDDFTVPVPDGVTLRSRPGSLVYANLTGDGVQAITFAGSVTLERLSITRFAAITVSRGKQRLTNVFFDGVASVTGSAEMHCEGCTATYWTPTGTLRARPLIEVRERAKLTFVSGQVNDFTRPDISSCQGLASDLIHVTGSADLVFEDSLLRGDAEHLLYLETQGSVKIASSSLTGFCPGRGAAVAWRQVQASDPTSSLDIEDSTFTARVVGTGNMQRVRVRRSYFSSFVISSLTPATYDLGLPGGDGRPDAGENSFPHLSVTGSDITVFASGNTWAAGAQDADVDGHYPIGDSRTVTGGERIEGSNFDLTSQGGPVKLLF